MISRLLLIIVSITHAFYLLEVRPVAGYILMAMIFVAYSVVVHHTLRR